MKLDTKNWQPFKVGELFYKLENGKANQTMLEEGEDCFYVGAKRSENGVMFRCAYNESLVQKGNCIIFICNGEGSVGYANYMSMDFIGTTDIVAGYNENINEYTGPFIATVASLERPKFSYGRKWKKFLKNTELYLPVDGSGNPDWQFMENYLKSLHSKPITTKNSFEGIRKIDVATWENIRLADYFDVIPGKYHYPDEYEEGSTPYYSASNENNGIAQYISLKPDFEGNCIITGKIGCTAFYAPEDFCATSDVNIFRPKFKMSQYVGIFLATIINFSENYKWAYGRQCRVGDSKNIYVNLPVTPEGEPDWQFMEDYIKSLPYGDRIK